MRSGTRPRQNGPIGRWLSVTILLLTLYAMSMLVAIGKHTRTKSAIRRSLLPDKPELVFPEMPRVVMIFLSVDGTDLLRTWEDWYADWLKYLREHDAGDEIGENLENPYLKGVLYRNPGTNLETVELRTPKFARENIILDPVPAKRFRLLNATRQAFETALEAYPDATHYSFISPSTIPVKPFSFIWGQLSLDRRSKLDVYCAEHREGYPKHSQWITLRKDHAEALVRDHQVWKLGANLTIRGTCPTLVAANDEYWPVRIISESLHYNSSEEYQKNFDVRLMQHPLGTLNWRTFVDWGLYADADHDAAVGVMTEKNTSSHPGTFVSITARFLRILVATENVWFARKFQTDLTRVTGCNDHPLAILGDALQGELRSPSRTKQSPAKMPEHFGSLFDCALSDFLNILLTQGAWAPVVPNTIPASLKDYVSTERDEIKLGEGGLFSVWHVNGSLVEGGLDYLLAGTLLGSNRTGGPGLNSKVVVEFRPLHVTKLDSLAEAIKKAEANKYSSDVRRNTDVISPRDLAIWRNLETYDFRQESDMDELDSIV